MGVTAARLQFNVLYTATITILLCPFWQSDRIPNRLSTCIDHNAVELNGWKFVHSSSDLANHHNGELCLNWVSSGRHLLVCEPPHCRREYSPKNNSPRHITRWSRAV